MSKYEKEFEKEMEKAIKEKMDKMTPEERENLRNTFKDFNSEEHKKELKELEESFYQMQESSMGLVDAFNFNKVVGVGKFGHKVLDSLVAANFKQEALIKYDSSISKEDKERLKWSDFVLIVAGDPADISSIEAVADLLMDDEQERFVMAAVPTVLGNSIDQMDAVVAVPGTDIPIFSQVICDIISIKNNLFSGEFNELLKDNRGIAVVSFGDGDEDERASQAARSAIQKLKDNSVESDNCTLLLCVTGGSDFDTLEEWETMEIVDIIRSAFRAKVVKCSRREKGMDGRLRVTVVAVSAFK